MPSSSDLNELMRAAARLCRPARLRNPCALPPLLVLTDPARTPDPVALAERLPPGAGLIYRAFGAADALQVGRALARVAARRRLLLLIGADMALAQACGAAGVHLPERLVARAPRLRARWPDAVITGAAHGAGALLRARAAGLDAALLSKVFPSASASSGAPLGPIRFASLVRGASLPVYALGGVNASTIERLGEAGVAGVAVVQAAAGRGGLSAP